MRFRTGIVALMAAGLALTACSSDGDGGDAPSIASPSADANGPLKVWLMEGGQPQSVIDAVNAEFNKSFPNVTVDVEIQEWAGIQEELNSSLSSDSAPDVVTIDNALTAKYAAAGLLADLSGEADEFGVSNMLPGLQPSGELDGVRYGIPYHGGVRIVVYKKSDFEKAKVGVPNSLAELGTIAEKLQAANAKNDQYSAFFFPGRYWSGALPFVWTHGGDIATQADDGTWTGALDSAESRAGLTQLKGLVEKYSKAPKDEDETKNVEAFNTGNVGMMIDSWWVPGVLDSGKLKGDIGVFALPGVDANTTAPVLFNGSDLAVSIKSRNQGLGVAWMKILTGLKIQTQLAKEQGVIPNQEGAFVGHKGNPFLEVADQASTNSQFTPVSPNWATVESSAVLQDMLVSIFTGQQTVEEATTAASQQITTTLNRK